MEREELIISILNPKTKNDKIIFDTYKELFAAAGGDFEELVKNGKLVDGRIEIPMGDYYISKEDYSKIIEEQSKRLKKSDRKSFRLTIALGCSPNIKK